MTDENRLLPVEVPVVFDLNMPSHAAVKTEIISTITDSLRVLMSAHPRKIEDLHINNRGDGCSTCTNCKCKKETEDTDVFTAYVQHGDRPVSTRLVQVGVGHEFAGKKILISIMPKSHYDFHDVRGRLLEEIERMQAGTKWNGDLLTHSEYAKSRYYKDQPES